MAPYFIAEHDATLKVVNQVLIFIKLIASAGCTGEICRFGARDAGVAAHFENSISQRYCGHSPADWRTGWRKNIIMFLLKKKVQMKSSADLN